MLPLFKLKKTIGYFHDGINNYNYQNPSDFFCFLVLIRDIVILKAPLGLTNLDNRKNKTILVAVVK